MRLLYAREMWESDREEALALPRRNIVFTVAGRLQFCYAVIRHYAPVLAVLFASADLAGRSSRPAAFPSSCFLDSLA